ncbi:helix-turn-helix domain-containing protein [Nocardioides conyzicola]|uniref:helix-turn-helix domain-containing protein n=1 Tax=Nocardioides conyzicola TaxID=1651781 RepID=UPI003CD05ECA
MPYPSRPVLEPLPQFVGTNTTRPTANQRAELVAYVAKEYQAGRSLRELAELTARTQTAVRRALDCSGVRRRPRGACPITAVDGPVRD